MASRVFLLSAVRATQTSMRMGAVRGFTNSAVMRQEVVAPIKKPVGAFRGGMFGFLSGAVAAGAAMYYYVVDEYRVSNTLLNEDIYALQSAVQRIEAYVKTLEEKVKGHK
ncbi:hypothetical protein GQ43DRAFT_377506 [Delitschia confertaspora ATCC 74209]|uniref:Uncharacterized protein n=1 Tax=Delitschia confertaspora ATCC 74209 TaxID=1513339 RepID=A0A9P4JGC2_9PLEO|nr:hypothetical protein GQ43DRAFT_377506 [Delitschia confertaspora ATCC 74209]